MLNKLAKNTFSAEQNIKIVRGKGAKVWDSQGKEYLDFSSQTLNLNLGQAHPEINRVVFEQMNKYTFLSSRFISKPFVDLAEALVEIAPKSLTKVNIKLTNGSDANESAFKRVRKFTGKSIIASFYKSHLGETSETLSASGGDFENKNYIGGSGNFVYFQPPHPNFLPECKTIQEAEDRSLSVFYDFAKTRKGLAAVVVETVMVNAGVYLLSSRYLKELRKMCDKFGIALIFDEIQTAFGWLGTFFACTKLGVTPDLLTLGKGLSSGFPLAGVLMKPEYDILEYGEDEFTYGGHPLSCVAALKNIEILKKIFDDRKVEKTKKIMSEYLHLFMKKYQFIKEIRGIGIIWAIDFDVSKSPHITEEVYNRALRNGLILRKSEGGEGSSLVLKPPVIISESEVRKGFDRLEKALKG